MDRSRVDRCSTVGHRSRAQSVATLALSLVAVSGLARVPIAVAQPVPEAAPGSSTAGSASPPTAAPQPPSAAALDAPPPAPTPDPPPPTAAATTTSVIALSNSEPPDVARAPERSPREHRTRCLLGSFCIGPVLTAGVLDVFGIGAQARTTYWGIGIDYQFVHFTTQGIGVRLSLLTVEGRVYPFGGAFFLAAGLAWQSANLQRHISYPGDNQVPPIEADLAGKINIPVFKLGLGFMGRSGFVMGIDLALGIQLGNNTVELSSNLPQIAEVVEVQDKIRNRADAFVRNLPFTLQANVLRFGYLF